MARPLDAEQQQPHRRHRRPERHVECRRDRERTDRDAEGRQEPSRDHGPGGPRVGGRREGRPRRKLAPVDDEQAPEQSDHGRDSGRQQNGHQARSADSKAVADDHVHRVADRERD